MTGIKHVTNKSTEDPEATGLVEAFIPDTLEMTAGSCGWKTTRSWTR